MDLKDIGTIGDLKKTIAEMPDSVHLVIAKDPEGNSYNTIGKDMSFVYERTRGEGLAILWPFRENVDINFGVCVPCDTEVAFIGNTCTMCASEREEE